MLLVEGRWNHWADLFFELSPQGKEWLQVGELRFTRQYHDVGLDCRSSADY